MEDLAELVLKAQRGDVASYSALVRRLQNAVYGYAYARLGNWQWAEDVVQETFIEAYRRLGQLREPRACVAWLRRIALKHCDRVTRDRANVADVLEAEEVTSGEAEPAQTLDAHTLTEQVAQAIAALPEHQRTATVLYYMNGYSQREVADLMGIRETTVRNRLLAARRHLQERMLDMVVDAFQAHALPADLAENIGTLVGQVVEITKRAAVPGFVALYAHGSFVRGDLDAWSNINILMLLDEPRDDRATRDNWHKEIMALYEGRGFLIDVTTLPLSHVAPGSPYWIPLLMAEELRTNGRLLLGRDVRGQMGRPTPRQLCLAVAEAALMGVRDLYDVPRNQELTSPLPALAIAPARTFVSGTSAAGQVYATVLHLLRAILYLETGRLPGSREAVLDALRRLDPPLASYCTAALALRREAPRFGPLERAPEHLGHLVEAIPALTARLFAGLGRQGLKDPVSHEAEYLAQGV